ASGAPNGNRIAGGVNSDLGLFVEDDWRLGPVVLTGGLRADRWSIRDGYMQNFNAEGAVLAGSAFYEDRSDWEVTYRAGAMVEASPQVRRGAAAYRGLRLPTLNELYRPFVVFPITTNANATLDVERLEGFEAGIDWLPMDGVRLSVTAFDNEVKNA